MILQSLRINWILLMTSILPVDIYNQAVIDIAETIEQQKKDLDKLYGDKIIELCKNIVREYNGINNIYHSIFGETKLEDFPQTPAYWYDYNKGKFIPAINGYQGKIFKTINFQIYNSEYIFHKNSTYKTLFDVPYKITHQSGSCNGAVMTQLERGYINGFRINEYENPQYININFDDHLNLYLLKYNIIIIRNYSAFSFASIDNIFDVPNIRVYNNKNDTDKCLYLSITQFINTLSSINSSDERSKMNNDLFNKLFDFIEYDIKLNKIKQNIKYIDILTSQGSKPIQDELNNIKIKLADTHKELKTTREKLNTNESTYAIKLKQIEQEYFNELDEKDNEIIKVNDKLKKTQEELDKYTNIIVPDMTQEQMKYKIKHLEKIIMALENDLSTYKGEVLVYKQYYDTRQKEILQLQENNINLTEIIAKNQIDISRLTNETINMKMLKSTITTLTQQIKDIEAIRDEENLNFNKKLVGLNGTINNLELDKIEQNKKITKITELEIEIDKMKLNKTKDDDTICKLNDIILKLNTEKQSIISKCVLLNDRIIELEKQNKIVEESIIEYNNTEEILNKKIITFENIITEKENEISIIKQNKITSLEAIGVKGDYEGILYSQIKELETENIKYKQLLAEKENEIKIQKTKYSDFENRIKSLMQ